jgi:ElaB/YqjD/DUF883 family membrane-anchored ribosome-binding protein
MAQFQSNSGALNRLATDARSTIDETVETVREKASDALDSGREKAEGLLEQGKKRVKRVGQDFEELLFDHPYSSVLIAMGVGALIGYMIPRRK